ncbi:MAG: penicillin-binding transpeptidase domain-containing protein [Verrucomicrobiota bacterium]|nr:penicillin-binding transpeptidase domain-containing protein [Verrucomicrobiota bacterium]
MELFTYKRQSERLLLFYGVFAILLVILLSGLFYRQIIQAEAFMEQEKRQNFRRILMPGPRGNIYDREGRLLVGNRALFSAVVYLNELRPEFRKEYIKVVREARESAAYRLSQTQGAPLKAKPTSANLQSIARQRVVQRYLDELSRILGRKETVKAKALERHFTQNLLLPLPLLTDLKEEEFALLIEQLPVDSPVQIITDSTRYYPYGSLASHTLGYVVASEEVPDDGLPGEDLMTFRFKGRLGRSGLEKGFDATLQGVTGGEIWVVDPSGFQYKRTDFQSPVKGQDLYSSLDIDVQQIAEKSLGRHVGAVVALDVQSGEVLALVSKPDYDLNDLTPFIPFKVDDDIRTRGAWLNRATQGLYPPGSTFKVVSAIAGLQSGVLSDESILCPGYTVVGARRFWCHKKSGHGEEPLEWALRDSCNVFFYQSGVAMGPEPIAAVARRFGLDKPTGIDLPSEATRMIVPDTSWKQRRYNEPWYVGDTANYAIGQGFLLQTPLQMACFTASLARKEYITKPTLVRQPQGSRPASRSPLDLTPAQYQRILDGMELSANSGTGKFVAIPGLRTAAKTGTAQVWVKGAEMTIAWTIAFAPIEAPRIAIVVMIEGTDPDDNYHGGTAAAPIARDVFRTYFSKLGIISQETLRPPEVGPIDDRRQ